MERQLSEFDGGSRGSSVKNMSRSVTPQKRNSVTQWQDVENIPTQPLFQHNPSDSLPAVNISGDISDASNIQQQDIHMSSSTVSNKQFYTQTSNVPYCEHLSAVPSSYSQNFENIATNCLMSPTRNVPLMTKDFSYHHVGTEPAASLDCADVEHQRGLSTPSRDASCHRLQQQQHDQDNPHGLDPNAWENFPQPHHLDEQTRLLLEHRHSLVQGHFDLESHGPGVRRTLFSDLDLSLPVSSPVPTSESYCLHRDLLAIQRTPSLDLSDLSEGPVADRHRDEDNLEDLLLYQSAQANQLEEYDAPQNSDFKALNDTSISEAAISEPVIGEGLINQADFSHELSIKSATRPPHTVVSLEPSPMHTSTLNDVYVSQHSSQSGCSSPQATHPEDPWQSFNLQPNMNASRDHNNSQTTQSNKDFSTRQGMSLGLVNFHKSQMDKHCSNSNSSINSGVGCNNTNISNSNSNSNNSSNSNIHSGVGCGNTNRSNSNTSSFVDLPSPQASLPLPSLPPHLRHSLDMSASSQYSDSSAPSSSGAGDVVRQLFVPYTGWASLHATGAVWILYNDGTQVGIKSTEPAMVYVDQDGTEARYSTTDTVPEIVRLKLKKLPSIVDQLMKAPVTIAPGHLSHSVSKHKA
ncbi:hypothetical protein EGW08_012957 [Elysia chlorotica]|uniref:POLO box domain-containing protein n=1 Tax=Elysia chlorotica TaxID=188477 RepID=A0A3S1HH55_ELYCH|nr:hypothetical protein EGW08_012957 [Elysia chlorotica]